MRKLAISVVAALATFTILLPTAGVGNTGGHTQTASGRSCGWC